MKLAGASSSRVHPSERTPHKGHTKIRAFLWIVDIESLRDLVEQARTERGQREFALAFEGGTRDEKITEACMFAMTLIAAPL